jgi:hypothetical protein
MPSQTITLDLPDHLYEAASRLAQATQRPVSDVLQDTLAHALPPLHDVPSEDADILAHMSSLDDPALWQASRAMMPEDQRDELRTLLDAQVAYLLPADIISRLHPCRLNDTHQPVVRTQNRFSTLRPTQLVCI